MIVDHPVESYGSQVKFLFVAKARQTGSSDDN
jgi:hypothetical protein